MKIIEVGWGDKTKIGTVRDGLRFGMRIEMVNGATGARHIEQRWYEPRPEPRPLAHPGRGQHSADWMNAVARARAA